VWLDEPSHAASHHEPQAASHKPSNGSHAEPLRDTLLDELRADIAYLRQALEREQIAHGETRQLLLAEQTRRLPAPVDVGVTTRAETAENRPASADSTQTPPRPWWAVWRR
jgi:hypothetical protein